MESYATPVKTHSNGHSSVPQRREEVEVFDAKEVVGILVDLMKGVTAKEKTAATVNAAVGCAGKLTDILRVHLDAKRLDLDVRRFEASQQQKERRGISKNVEEDC